MYAIVAGFGRAPKAFPMRAHKRACGIGGSGKNCDDNDAQPGASAAATTTMSSRATVKAFFFHLAIQGAATEFCFAGQMHRTRDARAFGCHSFVRRVAIHRVTSDFMTCWRAASTEAFAPYVIVAGCGRAQKTFPCVRTSVRAVALCASCKAACRANSA